MQSTVLTLAVSLTLCTLYSYLLRLSLYYCQFPLYFICIIIIMTIMNIGPFLLIFDVSDVHIRGSNIFTKIYNK